MLSIPLNVSAPRNSYIHGWGTECSNGRMIKGSWKLTVMDNYNYPITLEFDIVDGHSPIILGLDTVQYADTYNRSRPRTLTIRRPQDKRAYTLHTYTADDETGNQRLRLQIVPHASSPIRTLISTTDRHGILTMAKRIHRFGHANEGEMRKIMEPMKYDDEEVKRVCKKVQTACAICAMTGRPVDRKKISTTHIHAAFNDEIQVDYLYAEIHDTKYEILNIIDTGTRYGERMMTTCRSAENMKQQFETNWFYVHGAPSHFSADHEFCRPTLNRFLTKHSITLHPRPSRSSNKTGKVERNNGVFKAVLDRLQKADEHAVPQVLIARASFLTNLFRGSKVMSAFQLARGFTPSILGIPRAIVSGELLDAHVERESIRALERIMKSKSPETIDHGQLTPGTKIATFHKSSKQNEPNQWISAVVVKADEHVITCRRRNKGPPMTVSHNDVRLMPSGDLTEELMRYENEDDFTDDYRITNPNDDTTNDQTPTGTTRNDAMEETGAAMIHEENIRNTTTGVAEKEMDETGAADIHDEHMTDSTAAGRHVESKAGGTEIPSRSTMIGAHDQNDAGMVTTLINDRGSGVTESLKDDERTRQSHDDDKRDDWDRMRPPHDTCKVKDQTDQITEAELENGTRQKDAMNTHAGTTKDVGQTVIADTEMIGDLESDVQKVLTDIHNAIGNKQVTISKLQLAPSWITTRALKEEHDNNWAEAYREIDERLVPKHANVISSHVIYKIKTEESGIRRLKARLCPHGNRDIMKDDIRKDSATAQFDVIRLMLTITTFLPMRIGVVDISGAYMQSGPIKRDIYVRPPREWEQTTRGRIWKLLKLPYGVTEAGRQWATVIEDWLTTDMKMKTITGVSQIFVKRKPNGSIQLLLAKITDDLLFAGTMQDMNEFVEKISARFKISKAIIDAPIDFNGCRITQDEHGDISMNMTTYVNSIQPMDVTRNRRKEAEDKATEDEYQQYRSLSGSIMWAGNGTLPQAAFTGSFMQQKAPKLRVHDLTEGNKMLKELKDLNPTITFRKLRTGITKIDVWTFSDASFNIVSGRDYGQTGIVTGIRAEGKDGEHAFHLVDWASTKQRRISHSSYGAEILACSDADDRGFYLKQALTSMDEGNTIRHILHIDSRGLFDTISTLHDGKEYRLRQTVQRIRDSFEAGDIDVLRWVPTGQNIADGLTKRCPAVQRKFNRSSALGTLTIDNSEIRELVSKEWK